MSQQQPYPTTTPPAKPGMSRNKKIAIVLGVIAIIVVGLIVVDLSFKTTVNITAENLNIIYPGGATNGWLGPSQRTNAVSWSGNGGDQAVDTLSLYSTSSSTQQIMSMTVTTPGFSIVSVSPSTPITFSAGATVSITLTIQTPYNDYNGPIDIQISTA